MRVRPHCFDMPFVVDKKSGKTYHLHHQKVFQNGQQVNVYYFGDESGASGAEAIPAGCEVLESYPGVVRNGVITLQKGVKLADGTKVSITPATQTAPRLRGYRKGDPDFERAITAFAEAEASGQDPLEGEVIDLATDSPTREQFRKLLAGG